MKAWLLLVAALACLVRLPNPARDIARLEPVEVLWLHTEQGKLCIETDTGARGTGQTLADAAEHMRENATGEIFLDTAEFLLLHPEVSITPEFYTLLRPSCKVAYISEAPDMEIAAAYLTTHPPTMTLRKLR